MAISERCDRISALLTRLKRYDAIVRNDSFTNSALDEMKQNCRDIIKDAKDELNEIKKEVDSW
ncbi:hypothetical protein ES704_02716 [subsurface metagenome]|jgi:vacuolar-type H+-ATPase subunit H